MYLENKTAIDALPSYELNVAKANELLDQTPYKFEADGKTAFDAVKTSNGSYYRHDAQGERLVINHVDSESGNLNDPTPSQLLANAPLAGIDWQAHRLDFSNILSHYYDGPRLPQGQRLYHSFSLATNFSTTFDPFSSYHTDAQHNYVRLSDPELDEIMVRMRSLDPEEREQFSAEWVTFQTRWNQLLPMVPINSSHYYDVYRLGIQGFKNTPFVSWADLVCEISKAE